MYIALGDLKVVDEEAVCSYEKALAFDPDYSLAYIHKAITERKTSQSKALTTLNSLTQRVPDCA